MLNDLLSERIIHGATLVARQRRLLGQLRDSADSQTISNAERLLRALERSLITLLTSLRYRRSRRQGRSSSFDRDVDGEPARPPQPSLAR